MWRAPVAASQILSVLSSLPLTTLAPSGEKEQEVTRLECPLNVRFSTPATEGAVRSILELTSPWDHDNRE